MAYETWFDTAQNKTLLAICARRLIKSIGVGAVIWGLVNMGLGIVAVQENIINVGLIMLGLLMLGSGVQALLRPTLRVLLTQTVVAVLLLVWNVGITILNIHFTGQFDPRVMIFPVVIAIVFFRQYTKQKHIADLIASVKPDEIKGMKTVCRGILKKKLKNEPAFVQANGQQCRAQLMGDSAFFVHRSMLRAFVAPKDAVRQAIVKADAKSLKMRIDHPLEKLKYRFDKKNSEKIRNWLIAGAEPAAMAPQST